MSRKPTQEPTNLLVRESRGVYRQAQTDEVLQAAQRLLMGRMQSKDLLTSPEAAKDFLKAKLGALEHEVFAALMLDSQHRLIAYVELFRGTVGQTSVHPREVVKEGLARNAAAMILVHNHPSGLAEPSRADELLTQTLKSALALVDIITLDHFVVTSRDVMSFAERGLI